MSSKNLAILAVSLVAVMVLVIIAALLPIYRLPDGSYQRRWIWDAPSMPVRHGYDNLSPEDIARLSADPAQRKILEDMKNLPRTIPIRPIFIGS